MSKKVQFDRTAFGDLTPDEQFEREKALDVLKAMRKHHIALDQVGLPTGMTTSKVVRHIRSALKKKGSTYEANPTDRIGRGMNIIENGKPKSLEVSDFQEASKIGSYGNAVKKFLYTGDESHLQPFVGMTVKDRYGRVHKLETRPKMVLEGNRRSPGGVYEIYG